MPRIPILDLHHILANRQIRITVGEAMDSNCNGRLTVTIFDVHNGRPMVRTTMLTNLSRAIQDISIPDTPITGRVHPVVAVLQLDSGENRQDDEFISLRR